MFPLLPERPVCGVPSRSSGCLLRRHADHEVLRPASESSPRAYPPPDGEITFALNDSLFRSGTNHDHDQPPHLRLRNGGVPETVNRSIYAGPESRYCPAGVSTGLFTASSTAVLRAEGHWLSLLVSG